MNINIGGSGRSGDVFVVGKGDIVFRESSLESDTAGPDPAGSITISTPGKIRFDNTQIISDTSGQGRAGDISVKASEDIILAGSDTQIFANTSSETALGGNITFTTPELTIEQGAQVAASSSQQGQAGNLIINSIGGNVTLTGEGSLLAAEAFSAGGGAGSITANADTFTVTDNARVSIETIDGIGGNVNLNVDELLIENALISARTQNGTAGDLLVNGPDTPSRNIRLSGTLADGTAAGLSVEATGDLGNAGRLEINTRNLNLENNAQISAETLRGNIDNQNGDIRIQNLDTLLVQDARISASTEDGTAGFLSVEADNLVQLSGEGSGLFVEARGQGDAGFLSIDTNRLIIEDGAQATVSTVNGKGGNLTVQADESVLLTGGGGLFAQATGTGAAGDLNLTTEQLRVEQGSEITVSSLQGQAGNLSILTTAQSTPISLSLNQGEITAVTGAGEGGNISIRTQGAESILELANGSLISAEAFNQANGGNIDLSAGYVLALPQGNNDIIANALDGAGGNIRLQANQILGLTSQSGATTAQLRDNQTNDISASSQFSRQGNVQIQNLAAEPTGGLDALPSSLADSSNQLEQSTCQATQGSRFSVTGRGGLPLSSNAPLGDGEDVWQDLRLTQVEEVGQGAAIAKPTETTVTPNDAARLPLTEAQGLQRNHNGEVVLYAQASTRQKLPLQSANCHTGAAKSSQPHQANSPIELAKPEAAQLP